MLVSIDNILKLALLCVVWIFVKAYFNSKSNTPCYNSGGYIVVIYDCNIEKPRVYHSWFSISFMIH
jgi:hypothetical protein